MAERLYSVPDREREQQVVRSLEDIFFASKEKRELITIPGFATHIDPTKKANGWPKETRTVLATPWFMLDLDTIAALGISTARVVQVRRRIAPVRHFDILQVNGSGHTDGREFLRVYRNDRVCTEHIGLDHEGGAAAFRAATDAQLIRAQEVLEAIKFQATLAK